jgi:hypothetical protein
MTEPLVKVSETSKEVVRGWWWDNKKLKGQVFQNKSEY